MMLTQAQSKARMKEVSKAMLTLKRAEQKSKLATAKFEKIGKLYEKARVASVEAGLELWNAKMEFSDTNSWSKS